MIEIETIVDQSQILLSKIFDVLSSSGQKRYQQTTVGLCKDVVG